MARQNNVAPDDIAAAWGRIQGAVNRTPCHLSRTLSAATGAEVWIKFENLQFTASFKERGALNALLLLSAEEQRRGVAAMSAGNHAQGVAYHAGRLGIPALIVMPLATPNVKVARTQDFGARVVLHGESLTEAAAEAHRLAEAEGLVFLHPYDDANIIAGQGTVALEMLADAPDLEQILVPVGGGGLLAGMAVAAKKINPDIEVTGVESEFYASFQAALEGREALCGGTTIAEGIAVAQPGQLPLKLAGQLGCAILAVPDAAIEQAIAMLLEIEKSVAEGAGAAGLAALMTYPERFRGRRVGLVVSGGNIDNRLLASVLLRGLAHDGRLVRLRVDVGDAPGALARVAGIIAAHRGNIVDVAHQRLFGDIAAKAVELDLTIETQGCAHAEAILETLRSSGLAASLLDASPCQPARPG
jgi:threonine dehydratase